MQRSSLWSAAGRMPVVSCSCLARLGPRFTLQQRLQRARTAPTSSCLVARPAYFMAPASWCPAKQLQEQQQQCQRRVQAQAIQVDQLLGGLSGVPGWVPLGAMLVVGVLLGLALAKAANNYLSQQVDGYYAGLENAELRSKVEELQQLVLKVQPLAYKSMRLRFTKGINKAVILGMVDTMLANKEVNIWWLPDSIERVFYFNMMTLMLSVLDEVVDGMSISLAGHNVRLQLTHLDVAPDGEATSKQAQRTEALLKHAMQPPKTFGPHSSSSSSSSTSGGGGSGSNSSAANSRAAGSGSGSGSGSSTQPVS